MWVVAQSNDDVLNSTDSVASLVKERAPHDVREIYDVGVHLGTSVGRRIFSPVLMKPRLAPSGLEISQGPRHGLEFAVPVGGCGEWTKNKL